MGTRILQLVVLLSLVGYSFQACAAGTFVDPADSTLCIN